MCHRSYEVAGAFHGPFVLSMAWWISIFSSVFLVLFFMMLRNRFFESELSQNALDENYFNSTGSIVNWSFVKCFSVKAILLNSGDIYCFVADCSCDSDLHFRFLTFLLCDFFMFLSFAFFCRSIFFCWSSKTHGTGREGFYFSKLPSSLTCFSFFSAPIYPFILFS